MSEAEQPLPLSVDAPQALPAGTRVAEFEVRSMLGSGGFGIVYLAWDHALEREVALKEYMPGTLAGRGTGLQVSVRSKSTAETFALGLRSFINEARLLARFDHPSLVKVYRFWEDNGTAYMVMPYYVGRTLRQAREGMVVPPGEAACQRVLDGVLSALETLHREGVFHRDIAPDNILLGDDGLPVLLDFGAARRVLSDRTQALTSIMKPHYAPLEQYADANSMRQGPWTDLYALGGTLYFLLTGEEPVAAASRALHDDQPRLAELRPRDCTPGFLAAIDWMLALKPPERPQSVHMLRDVLEGRITLPGRAAADKTVPGVAAREGEVSLPARTDIDPSLPASAQADANAKAWAEADAAAFAATAAKAAAATVIQFPGQPVTAPGVGAAPVPASLFPKPLALLAALVLLNLFAWWWFTRSSPQLVAATPAQASVASAPGASAPMQATVPPAHAPGQVPDSAAVETIISVMPARPAASRPALAASGVALRTALDGAASASVAAGASSPPLARVRTGSETPQPMLPAAAQAAGPRAACGERNFLSLLICMKRECEQPALQGHPECVKMREQEEAQRNRAQ